MLKGVRVKFIGYQECRTVGRYALYNLLEPMGEHPVGSTVSGNTIGAHRCEPCIDEQDT